MEGLTEGRIVHYILDDADAKAINQRRKDADLARNQRATNKVDAINVQGFQEHVGNQAEAGMHVPMVIVRVWSQETGMVNGKALLDGNDDLWVTSRALGDGPGTWHWIEKS